MSIIAATCIMSVVVDGAYCGGFRGGLTDLEV